MLLLDVSNIMYTGVSARSCYYGKSSEFTLCSIPYIFQKIASYYSEDTKMIAVFEKVSKIPALARESGYKSGRPRNPFVEWEIASLQKLLELIGFPVMYIEGQESDYIINNYCRLNGDKENISIVSADMDLAANVKSDKFQTKMLSYSTVSYNVNKANFKEITGVEYNFMNLNKILLGCNSDKIKAFPNGKDIYNTYIKTMYSLWRRRYGFNVNEQNSSDLPDSTLMAYTTYEHFINWYKLSQFYEPTLLNELDNRRVLIEGPKFDLPQTHGVDWIQYNTLVHAFNLSDTASVKAVATGAYDEQFVNTIQNILRQAQTANATIYDGGMDQLDGLAEVGNVSDILGLLSGGDL